MESYVVVTMEESIAKIELAGRLDATNAPNLQAKLKELSGQPITRMIFFADKLEYISSAGLRVIIFAKQKIGSSAQVYFIGAQEMVLDIIKMSGLDNFMILQDTYEGQ